MKRKLILLFTIVALLSILTTGTLAYRVTYGTAYNVVTAGNIQLTIHNCEADGTPIANAVAMACLPGSLHSRVVTVENTGDHPLYLRVSLEKYVLNSNLPADDCLNVNVNTTNWIYSNGYYYYLQPLNPGQTTQPLFTEVEIDGRAVDNAYLGKSLMLDVNAYGVQSENNADTVLAAVGWPEP